MANSSEKRIGNNAPAKSQSLVEGALILTVGVALVKLIGAIFKIPLGNIIGEAGMGYYYSAYSLYVPFFTLASAGFPAALSRQVAENVTLGRYRDAAKVRVIARNIFLITGTVCFIGMVAAGFILTNGGWMNEKAIYAILMMCPSVFFCCMMGAYRGYNEGMRNMIPTATSQVIEALGKLIIGLGTAIVVVKIGENTYLKTATLAGGLAGSAQNGVKVFGTMCYSFSEAQNASYPFAAAAALMGITLGSAASLIYLIIRYKLKGSGITDQQLAKSPEPADTKSIIKTFLRIGIPIALGVLSVNLTQLIDGVMIQSQLKSLSANGLRNIYGSLLDSQKDGDIPVFLYGVYNYGVTLYNLVPYLTQAFGTSALPNLASAWIIKDRAKIEESVNSVFKLSALLAFPAGVGLCALSSEILHLLYPGTAAAEICPPMLRVLGIMAIFGALAAPINCMLQAVGKQMTPVKLMLGGAVIKLVLNYVLVGNLKVNIMGAPCGSLACYVFIVVCSIIILCRTTKVRISVMSTFVKPLVCAALCGAAAWGTSQLLQSVMGSKIATLAAICVAAVVYIISLFALKTLTKQDVLLLPKGEKLAKVLEKRGLIV